MPPQPTPSPPSRLIRPRDDASRPGPAKQPHDEVALHVLLQVDPHVRLLFGWIQEYTKNRKNYALQDGNTYFIGMLQRQTQILGDLQASLEACQPVQKDERDDWKQHIRVLQEYLFLPVLAIFKSQVLDCWWFHNAVVDNDKEPHRLAPPVQSALLHTIQAAAETVSYLVDLFSLHDNETTTTTLLSSHHMQQLLSVMAQSLPTGRALATSQATTTTTWNQSTPCLVAMLETVSKLVVETNAHQPRTNERVPVDSLLLARLVDTCVGLIEPPRRIEANETSAVPSWNALVTTAPSTMPVVLVQKALQTLELLLTHFCHCVADWRRFFPGVYAGVYRALLSCLHASNQTQVAVQTHRVLLHLLQVTLPTPAKGNTTTSSPWETLLSCVSSASAKTPAIESGASDTTTDDSAELEEDEETRFVKQVKERLPGTLTVLMNLLTTSSRGEKLRLEVLGLCELLLLEKAGCLDDDQGLLSIRALESCLILTRDAHPSVSESARQLLTRVMQEGRWQEDNDRVSNRILTLLEEVASLAPSARERELQGQLRLAQGYLELYGSTKLSPKKLRATVSSQQETIRKALATLLDVEFDSLSTQGILNSAIVVVVSLERWQTLQSRYLDAPETVDAALDMVQALGRALGPKQTTVFVDACLADFYEACLDRVNRRLSLVGTSQSTFVHEWIGQLCVVQELLVGAFRGSDGVSQKTQKALRFLSSLSASILPILTSHPLFDLPTNVSERRRTSGDLIGSQSKSLVKSSEEVQNSALRGNMALTSCILRLVGTTLDLLSVDGRRFLPTVLFPIMEKMGSSYPPLIRDEAAGILHRVATSCSYDHVTALVMDNVSHLTGTMIGRLRVPASRTIGNSNGVTGDVISVADTTTALLLLLAKALRGNTTSRDESILSRLQDLTIELTRRFDYAAADVTKHDETTMSFVRLFDAGLVYLMAFHGVSSGHEQSQSNDISSQPMTSWLGHLEAFRKDRNRPELHTEKEFHCDSDATDKREGNTNNDTRRSLTSDTQFVSQMASRCGYLLSHSSLRVQLVSTDVLIGCFRFLGWVAATCSQAEKEESNGPSTAILRQVHASWPAISSRLKATTAAVTLSESRSLLVVSSHPRVNPPSNFGEQRIFLCKLLQLIAVMVENADDFMATRFRDIVWPLIGQLMRSFLASPRQRAKPVLLLKPNDEDTERSASTLFRLHSESERELLLQTLRCIGDVFRHRPTGLALAGLIPAAGTMIFPFFEVEHDDIINTCMSTLQSMIRVDCDSLWRPLLELSGDGLPPCPFPIAYAVDSTPSKPPSTRKLKLLAKDLVAFVHDLPEQVVG